MRFGKNETQPIAYFRVYLAGIVDEWRNRFLSNFGKEQRNNTPHPDLNESKGGSKSERNQSGTPLPKGDPSTGTVEKGKTGSTDMETPRSSETRKETGKKSGSDTTKGKDTDQSNQTPAR